MSAPYKNAIGKWTSVGWRGVFMEKISKHSPFKGIFLLGAINKNNGCTIRRLS